MAWIIDGNNLLGQIPGRSMLDPAHRRELAGRIARFCESRRGKASLYFDGTPLDGWRGTTWLGPLCVLHSGGGKSADDAILDLLARSGRPGDYRVVTSDRALSDRCRHLGAATTSVREFRSLLSEAAALAGGGSEKPDRVDPAEVSYFMELFGASEEDGEEGGTRRSRRRR